MYITRNEIIGFMYPCRIVDVMYVMFLHIPDKLYGLQRNIEVIYINISKTGELD